MLYTSLSCLRRAPDVNGFNVGLESFGSLFEPYVTLEYKLKNSG